MDLELKKSYSESGEDLSRFALPFIDSLDKVKGDPSMDDSTGEGTWSTAPSTPEVPQKPSGNFQSVPIGSPDSETSYTRAILNPELWDDIATSNRAQTQKHEVPKHISSPSSSSGHLQPVRRATPPQGKPQAMGPGVNVVTSAPANVQVGFFPMANLEATDPNELPGSCHSNKVITTPPHPSSPSSKGPSINVSRPRAESIEEADKKRENYVPQSARRAIDLSGYPANGEGNAFCLDLVTLIGAQPDDKQTTTMPTLLPPTEKLPTRTPSELSTISLAGSIEEAIERDALNEYGTEFGAISEAVYAELMSAHACYDIIPPSTKIVVFDTRLRVKKAFFALVANGVRAAPLWDNAQQGFVGMLTITDFINILRHHYKSPIVGMDELENQTVQMFRDSERAVAKLKSSLVQIDPMQSLYDAVKMLVEYKIHRLPVIDSKTGNALYILTHKRLLQFLYSQVLEGQQPLYMHKSLRELGIGTYTNIATASPSTPIIVALNIFHEKRVSALPIVNDEGKVVDIYAKFDVINLAVERTYGNLDVTLREALMHRAEGFEGVRTCLATESFYVIVRRIVATKVHRLVIVDEHHHVVGVVSLSDILKFLVLNSHDSC